VKRAVFLLLAFVAMQATSRADGTVTSHSAHYRLVSTGTQAEADEWTRMLEAAWPQYAEFFGKTPTLAKDAKLSVAFFETFADMQAAIRKAGGTPPTSTGVGGYYDPVSKAAYAWRPPTQWYTRTLVLHECAHQFHYWSRIAPKVVPPDWYAEGIAEHVSGHTWDGERLRLGVVPMLSLENRAGAALDAAKNSKFDVDALFDGKGEADRAQCMHVVRYLCQADGGKLRPKFDEIAAKLDRGAKAEAKAFAGVFGPGKKLAASIAAWLPSVQEPWEALHVDWDARAVDALRGSSPGNVSLCRRRADTRRVTARMRPVGTGAWKGGVLLRYDGPDDYDIGMLWSDGRAHIDRRKDGAWQILVDVAAPSADGDTRRVEGVRDGASVNFVVDGTIVGAVEASSGSMGLAVDSSTIDFTEIAAE